MEAGEQASGEALRARAVAHAEAAVREKGGEVAAAGADMREIERVVLLRTVDAHWMEHIDAMDQLRQGIGCAPTRRRTRSTPTPARALRCSTPWWPPSASRRRAR